MTDYKDNPMNQSKAYVQVFAKQNGKTYAGE